MIRLASGFTSSLAPTNILAALGDLCPAERLAHAMSWFRRDQNQDAAGGGVTA